MTKNSGELRQQKNSKHRHERQLVSGRQQHVEHGTSGGPVHDGDQQLCDREPCRWDREFPVEKTESLVARSAEHQVAGDKRQTKRTQRLEGVEWQSQQLDRRAWLEHEDEACYGDHADDERGSGKADCLSDLRSRQSPRAPESVANRTATQQGKAETVAEGVGDEGSKRYSPNGQRMIDVREGDCIVPGENGVRDRRQTQC